MKLIKNIRKRKKAKQKARIEFKTRKEYDGKITHLAEINHIAIRELKSANQTELQKIHDFYKAEFDKIEDKIKQKYDNIIYLRDQRIEELESYIDNNKQIYQYLKRREQELENIINIVGTKFQGYAELVTTGYANVQNIFTHVTGYNKKHLKQDTKIIEATNKE